MGGPETADHQNLAPLRSLLCSYGAHYIFLRVRPSSPSEFALMVWFQPCDVHHLRFALTAVISSQFSDDVGHST